VPRIAVDAMGGDRGPGEVVAGALAARSDALTPILYGDAGIATGGLELVATEGVIEMDDKPAEAVRAKPNSSMVSAVRAVHDGTADAVVSAGNTGAMLAAGLLELRRIPGVMRPAIAIPILTRRGPSVLLDSGANADARPEHLLQFATMGAVFAEEVLGVANPTVRLLSIGEEPEKGNQLALDAHELLAKSELDFRGNTEGRDILGGAADVVVTDGFTGNVVLKTLEGAIRTVLEGLRSEITATTTGKVGGLLIRPAARRLRARLDPDAYGGAYLLGLRGLAVIAHGNSSSKAIENAVRLAARGVEHDVVGRLTARMGQQSQVV
jgi:glycerol-3-phosphate acyltransferase PlsX